MKQEILEAVKKAKEESKPRNFTQSVDVVITIKDLDVKKPENRIEEEVFLPNGRGKDVSIVFIAEGELALQAKNAGADLMPFVGRFLGPVLGPRKKMPKPVPASAKPEPLIERLKNTAKVRIKDQPVIQAIVGTQDMDDELIVDNIEAVLDILDRKLEKGRKQIKSMYVKTTMGPVARVI